jgi:hypothetical protein
MSEWITDRLPTEDDAPEDWVFVMNHGNVVLYLAVSVELGMPWHPIVPPAPYVKPKRWAAVWHGDTYNWTVESSGPEGRRVAANLYCLSSRDNHAAAAQRIADAYNDAYNEVMP